MTANGAPALDRLLPDAPVREVHHVDVSVPPERAYEMVRHLDLALSPLVRALFGLRLLPDRIAGREVAPLDLRMDSIAARTGAGFRLLDEQPGSAFTVGAIGRFWKPDIEFADVAADRFASFAEPGWGKVAWEIRCEPRGVSGARIVIEVRVGATDETSWRRVRRYYRLIAPFSHFIRRHTLALVARELGALDAAEEARALPGDELVPDASEQLTHFVDIDATPAVIWPWLVQMGCGRGGWYSYDELDNGGTPSATRIHREWQSIAIGDVLPVTPRATDGFLVLRIDRVRVLVLGGVVDLDTKRTLPLGAPRPPRFWQTSWAFVLEPLDDRTTRLHVRARVAFAPAQLQARAAVMRAIHSFMEHEQLRRLKENAETSGVIVPAERVRPADRRARDR
jgi:hypothetical protein